MALTQTAEKLQQIFCNGGGPSYPCRVGFSLPIRESCGRLKPTLNGYNKRTSQTGETQRHAFEP
jgi:hypothetical protein